MIEYYTALVLSYTIQTHEIDTVVWFESERHCIKAMSSRTFDNMYDHIYELYMATIFLCIALFQQCSINKS